MIFQRFVLYCWIGCAIGCLIAFAGPTALSGQVAATAPSSVVNPAVDPTPRAYKWWTERHEQKLGRVRQGNCDLLFVGDSITQNYEKTGPAPDELFYPTWEFFYGARRAINLGFSGDDTEQVLWRLDHGEVEGLHPKVTVLLIGTNNTNNHRDWTSAETLAGVEAVVADLHQRLPRTKVLVVGILPTDLGEAKTAIDQKINESLKHDYLKSRFVTVLDIGQTFYKDGKLDTTLFYDTRLKPAKGALHPDTHGQAMMAAAIEPVLSKLLGDPNRLTFHPNPLDPAETKPNTP